MDEDAPYPPVPDALLAQLRKDFPDSCPDATVSMDEVRALAGVQRVIRFLAEKNRQQNEESNVLR